MKTKLLLLTLLCSMIMSEHSFAQQNIEFWFAPFLCDYPAWSSLYKGKSGFVVHNPTNQQAIVNIHHYADSSDTLVTVPAFGAQQITYTFADLRKKIENSGVMLDPVSAANLNFLGVPYTGGVHITSNVSVVIYYVYDYNGCEETALLKGEAALGNQFTIAGCKSAGSITSTSSGSIIGKTWLGSYSNLSIMGTEDQTSVFFNLKAPVHGFSANTEYSIVLNKGEILNLRTINNTKNLTGSIITSTKPISVTAGEESRHTLTGTPDPVAEQLVADSYAGYVYVMPLTGGYNNLSQVIYGGLIDLNNYVEIVSVEKGTTTVQADFGNGLKTLCTLNGIGDSFTSDSIRILSRNGTGKSCVTFISDKPVHIMHNTGRAASTCHIPDFNAINTHRCSFFTGYGNNGYQIYPAITLVYKETGKNDFVISYPGQTETSLFNWISSKARWIDDEGNVPQYPEWKYIRFTLPNEALNKFVSINNLSSAFQLGFISTYPRTTYFTYFSSFKKSVSFSNSKVLYSTIASIDSIDIDGNGEAKSMYAGCVYPMTLKFSSLSPSLCPVDVELEYINIDKAAVLDENGNQMPSKFQLKNVDDTLKTFNIQFPINGAGINDGEYVGLKVRVDGREDTLFYSKFYNKLSWNVKYKMVTKTSSGSLDINITNGGNSETVYRKISNGSDINTGWKPVSAEFTNWELLSIGDSADILLYRANECNPFDTVKIRMQTGDVSVLRYVDIPKIAGVTTAPMSGKHYVAGHDDFTFYAKYDGTPLEVNATGYYSGDVRNLEKTAIKQEDGSYKYTIRQVTEPWTISFGAEITSGDVMNDALTGQHVWANGNMLYIRTCNFGIANVYNLTGSLIKQIAVNGTTGVRFSKGFYIVVLNGEQCKVMIK